MHIVANVALPIRGFEIRRLHECVDFDHFKYTLL